MTLRRVVSIMTTIAVFIPVRKFIINVDNISKVNILYLVLLSFCSQYSV